jgi:hypothetical protein
MTFGHRRIFFPFPKIIPAEKRSQQKIKDIRRRNSPIFFITRTSSGAIIANKYLNLISLSAYALTIPHKIVTHKK